MGVVFTNNAETTLAAAISSTSATSISVTSSSTFPSLDAGEYFYATVDDGTNFEIVKITGISGTTWTIVRATDNSTARTFANGSTVQLRATAALLTDIQENIAAKSANQTVFSATAASNATAYNVGVDPGVEANASIFLDGVYQNHDTFSFNASTVTFDAAPTNGTKIEVVVDNLINLQSSNLTTDTFTATSGQTAFTLSDAPAAENNLIVFIDGVFQDQGNYSISNHTLTLATGAVEGRTVTVYIINPVNIGTPSDNTVTSAKLSGNITTPGTLTVGAFDVAFDSPTFFVDNSNSRVGLGTATPSVPVDIVGEGKISSHFTILDAGSLKVGTGADMVLSSDGTHGTIAAANGNLTVDVAGEIHLDADAEIIRIRHAGGDIGMVQMTNNDLILRSMVSDKDMLFKGNDGGSVITALTLNMSEAGRGYFNAGISVAGSLNLGDSNSIILGAGDDLQIFHDGSNSRIKDVGTGDLILSGNIIAIQNAANSETMAKFTQDGAVDLYHNDVKKLETTSSGVTVTGTLTAGDGHTFGSDGSDNLLIASSANENIVIDSADDIILDADGADIIFKDGGSTKGRISMANSDITLTASDDDLILTAADNIHLICQGNESGIDITGNGAVSLYHDNAVKLATSSAGVTVTGAITQTVASGGGDYHNVTHTGNESWSWGARSGAGADDYLDVGIAGGTRCMSWHENGNVNIGTSTNYGHKLGIHGNAGSDGSIMHLRDVGNHGSGRDYIEFWNSATALAGRIEHTSSTGVTYVTSSDYRMKENIRSLENGIDRVKQLNPVKFDWIESKESCEGFIAHEVDEIFTEAVAGQKDGEKMQGVDYGRITPLLVKAIQEQQTQIEELKKEVQELKSNG